MRHPDPGTPPAAPDRLLPRAAPPRGLSPEEAAPDPRIRVGLDTAAESVRLSSASPFLIWDGSRWIQVAEALLERDLGAQRESRIYRVQVTSFPAAAAAESLLRALEAETGLRGRVAREPVNGRFTVRLGAWSTAAGAETARSELWARGHEGARVVAEPSTEPAPKALMLHPLGAESLRLDAFGVTVLPGAPGSWLEVDGVPYRGFLQIWVNAAGRFTIANAVNLEDYLLGVVPAELSPSAYPELEAIKAQAVAARTYAMRRRGEFQAEGFDLCATPACQVYRGVGAEQAMAREAVAETANQILTYKGEVIDALYTSTCGGRTENVENVFSSSQPYLVSRPCFLEREARRLRGESSPAVSWETAGALILGVATSREIARTSLTETSSAEELVRWVRRALAAVGETPCKEVSVRSSAATVLALARALTEALCWEGRLPFLMTEEDADHMLPEPAAAGLDRADRAALAFWIQEGVLPVPPEGLRTEAPLSRARLLEALYRFAARRAPVLLREGRLVEATEEEARMKIGTEELRLPWAEKRYLFRRVGDATYFSPSLRLLPADRVLFHRGKGGVDLLIQVSSGASFDRSSRYSWWVVRKTAAELVASLGAENPVGDPLDLRPKRYGQSGRVAELEVVGSRGTMTLRGLAIRRGLGIRENLFFLDAQEDPERAERAWLFTGRGWGHGVGLCQVGAYGMAAAGYDYAEILRHYYPGTSLGSVELVY